MILLEVRLLTTLRLIPNEVLCFCRTLIHPSAWKGNSAKFAAFRAFSGKLASPRTFIVDSSLLARVSVGWVSTFSEQLLLFSELLVSFPVAHPSLFPLFTLVPRRHVLRRSSRREFISPLPFGSMQMLA